MFSRKCRACQNYKVSYAPYVHSYVEECLADLKSDTYYMRYKECFVPRKDSKENSTLIK